MAPALCSSGTYHATRGAANGDDDRAQFEGSSRAQHFPRATVGSGPQAPLTPRAARDHRARSGQAEYEARRASEQYHAVDARNRLVAAELERRWNAALEQVECLRSTLAEL
jgi:hypothetical protein